MRLLLTTGACLMGLSLAAQFDVGLSAGAFAYHMWYYNDPDERCPTRVNYGSGQELPTSMTLFYRERLSSRVSLATELQARRFVYRAIGPRPCRLGGMYPVPMRDYRVDVFNWSILPEYRLGNDHRSVFRFGVQLPLGSIGTERVFHEGTQVQENGVNWTPISYLIGFGHRLPLSDRWVIHMDGYCARSGPQPRIAEFGLKVGMAWQCHGRSFWKILRAGAPPRKTDP